MKGALHLNPSSTSGIPKQEVLYALRSDASIRLIEILLDPCSIDLMGLIATLPFALPDPPSRCPLINEKRTSRFKNPPSNIKRYMKIGLLVRYRSLEFEGGPQKPDTRITENLNSRKSFKKEMNQPYNCLAEPFSHYISHHST